MPYSFETYSGKSALTEPDVVSYFEARKKMFADKFPGSEAARYYEKYPNDYDARDNTVFLIFKATDPKTGKDVVTGGRRIVFPLNGQNGTLPFEYGRHRILDEERDKANRFQALQQKDMIDIGDVIPAKKLPNTIRCAEVGAFAIDQNITDRLFEKKEYIAMREAVYHISLEVAKSAGADIVVIGAGSGKGDARGNLEHQDAWLKSFTRPGPDGKPYEHRRLGATRDLFTNPFPKENALEMLIINVSDKYKLMGPKGLLRFNQEQAQQLRG